MKVGGAGYLQPKTGKQWPYPTFGCPAGSDRNDRDRKLVKISPIYGTKSTYLYRGEIIHLLNTSTKDGLEAVFGRVLLDLQSPPVLRSHDS